MVQERQRQLQLQPQQHYDVIVVGLGGVGSMALRALSRTLSSTSSSSSSSSSSTTTATADNSRTDCKQVLGVEAAGSPEDAGYSSRGETRIYRRAYFEHPSYVPWIEHSLQVIQEMEQQNSRSTTTGTTTSSTTGSASASLHCACGALVLEPSLSSSEFSSVGSTLPPLPPILQKSWDAAQQHNVPVELLSHHQLQERFPQFSYDRQHCMVGLYEPGAGLLRPERIQQQALAEATSNNNNNVNVQTLYGTRVVGIRPLPRPSTQAGSPTMPQKIELKLQRTDPPRADNPSNTAAAAVFNGQETVFVTTDYLLISMGGWTSTLIPSWNHILTPIRQLQGWVDVGKNNKNNHNLYQAGTMPCFVYKDPTLPHSLYGVPVDTDGGDDSDDDDDHRNRHWIKIGTHKLTGERALPTTSTITTSTTGDMYPTPERPDERAELEHAIPFALHPRAWGGSDATTTTTTSVAPKLVASKSCLYTVTPDRHFVIGTPQMYAGLRVLAVAGLSGHGYKMVPALGQMMADFCAGIDVPEKWQTEFCAPSRFGV